MPYSCHRVDQLRDGRAAHGIEHDAGTFAAGELHDFGNQVLLFRGDDVLRPELQQLAVACCSCA